MNLEQWYAGGRDVAVGPHRVFVRDEGRGPALLFLHGFPTSSLDWAPVIARLKDRFRCVAFDFVGFGGSSKPRIDYSYSLQLEAVEAVVRACGLAEAWVVAHDYGGPVAQELLARAAEQRSPLVLRGVVFCNSAMAPALHRPVAVQRFLRTRVGRALGPLLLGRGAFERSLRRVLARPERVDFAAHWAALARGGGRQVLPRLLHYIDERAAHGERWIAALRAARVPLAFAWGRGDPVSGAHVLEWICEALAGAPVLALEVGHYPQLEADEEVAAWIAARVEAI